MQVNMLDHLPSRLLEHPAPALARHLDGPTLIHLPGRKPDPLFVSVLQHGNEVSGWDAIRRLLSGRYQRDPLPRSLVLFIGNVRAAEQHKRHLPDQPDMNRCWPGSVIDANGWQPMLADLTRHVRALKPFASIDIHNNTGENPHYAAVNRIEAQRLNLASRFSRTVVFFTEPTGVQSDAFGQFCPAVTLECGRPNRLGGTDHAMAFVENILNMDSLSTELPHPEDLDLFQVTTVVRVPERHSFTFNGDPADLRFEPRLDQMNFNELPPGTRLARTRGNGHSLHAVDIEGVENTASWFQVVDGELVTRRPAMPAMLTTDHDAIRQDCLCYLMERIRVEHPSPAAGHGPGLPESAP
ncbi:MAG: M14 family metallopeptidase [Wenzhouxiangellaceae bacterium]|nr:M14 family metallopeptidase [Wenzhouxiangellaceae bacterium]